MADSAHPAIYLVPHKVAAQATVEAFTDLGLTPDMQRLAWWILTATHSRQAGITPKLAGEAALIVQPYAETQTGAWGAVKEKFDEVRELVAVQESSSLTGNGSFTFSCSVNYTIQRIFLPLVAAACRRLKMSCLFTNARRAHPIDHTQYGHYATHFEQALLELIQGKAGDVRIPALFWKDRLHTLQMLTAKQQRFRQKPVPHTNLLDSGLFWNLEPAIEEVRRKYQSDPIAMPNVLEDHRRWRPGADGIMHTHRMEDLGRILMSELVNEPRVLIDRINNEGYLAVKRPPLLVRLRDLMVMAVFPPETAVLPSSTFVKTVWFNFAWELARLLQGSNMGRSEMRWIEGDSWRRTQTSVLLMECLTQIPLHEDPTSTEAEPTDSPEKGKLRRLFSAFVNATEWFPSYLDLSEDAQVLNHVFGEADTEVSGDEPLMPFRRWALKAWKEQRESSYWALAEQGKPIDDCCKEMQQKSSSELFTENPINFDEYSHVHVMVFLPAHSRFDDHQSSIPGATFFEGANGLSVTRVPETLTGSGWQVTSFKQRKQAASEGWPVQPEKLAGALIMQWLSLLIKEMSYG